MNAYCVMSMVFDHFALESSDYSVYVFEMNFNLPNAFSFLKNLRLFWMNFNLRNVVYF